eukprot:6984610-Prymnesium_polylepis.1
MALSMSNPSTVVDADWQIFTGTSWKSIDQQTAATMETAFKGSSKTIKIGPSSFLPRMANFDVEAMAWEDMPVRRGTSRTQGGAVGLDVLMNEQLFSYWDDD